MIKKTTLALLLAAGCGLALNAETPTPEKIKKVRLIQDDAQDYMVSKVYELKYLRADDLAPFIQGMVTRYNTQSKVNRIDYKVGKKQYLTVSCPVGMMPYVDEAVDKLDRPESIVGKKEGDPIDGSGITRGTYMAKYRSGQIMVDIMVATGVNGGVDSLIKYDALTNIIYFKDASNKVEDLGKYLGWLDRPVPTANIAFTIYEVRESELRDLGIDYLGWKNGPGLDMFKAGFDSMSVTSAGTAAIQSVSGAVGGFFFAPQFDASFVRMLQQDGRANLVNNATMTVRNSAGTYTSNFTPQNQRIIKSNNDATSVGIIANSPLGISIKDPKVCYRGTADEKTGLVSPDTPVANLVFTYALNLSNVVERNNYGDELVETSAVNGNCNLLTGDEKIIGYWSKDSKVEQTIGVPFLSDIPVVKYLFGTTTTSVEKSYFFVVAKADVVNPDKEMAAESGQLRILSDVIEKDKK